MIKKASEFQIQKTIKALFYGQPGSGKSTLGLTAPMPLIIDTDGGINRLRPEDRGDYISVKSWEDCLSIKTEDLTAYQSIIVDTVGKALDYLSIFIIKSDYKMGKKDGSLALQGYGALKSAFSTFLNELTALGKNVILIAHDREEGSNDNLRIRPDVVGGSLGVIMREMDIVGYLKSNNNKRTVMFDPQDEFYAKNTCNLPAIMEIPDFTKKKIFVLTEVINQYLNKQIKQKELTDNYNELKNDIDILVGSVDSLESAKDVSEKIAKLPIIWDSKLQAQSLFSSKLKELGITYKDKQFVKSDKK